jgi:dihydropteroate synthase
MTPQELGEVLFEFRRVGGTVRVTAIHVATGAEIVMVGAASAGEHALKMAAMRKLAFVLGRKSG